MENFEKFDALFLSWKAPRRLEGCDFIGSQEPERWMYHYWDGDCFLEDAFQSHDSMSCQATSVFRPFCAHCSAQFGHYKTKCSLLKTPINRTIFCPYAELGHRCRCSRRRSCITSLRPHFAGHFVLWRRSTVREAWCLGLYLNRPAMDHRCRICHFGR